MKDNKHFLVYICTPSATIYSVNLFQTNEKKKMSSATITIFDTVLLSKDIEHLRQKFPLQVDTTNKKQLFELY